MLQEDYGEELDLIVPEGEEGRALLGDMPVAVSGGLRGSNLDHGQHRDLQSNTIIDVLVLWTPKAECANSNLSAGCTRTSVTASNMRARINLAVQETNTAYDLSGIDLELRLAHSELTSYTEESSDAFGTARGHLRGTNDGYMDNIHAKRTQYGAGKRKNLCQLQLCVTSKLTSCNLFLLRQQHCLFRYGGVDYR